MNIQRGVSIHLYRLAIQAAQKLEEGGVCTKDEFIAAVNDASRENKFVQSIKNPQERPFLLEGYIYPDTYDFYVGEGAEKALGRFLSNTESKLTDGMYKKAEELGMSMDEVITLASIIQQEASVPSVMANVSSVLHNRLNSPSYPRLQCDATIFYLKRSVKPYISGDVNRYNSLYNMYKCKGLPAGPIANPGMNSIRAALYPAETDYYFYALDTTGVHHFSETYYEHQNFLNELAGKEEEADQQAGTDDENAEQTGDAADTENQTDG